jgi:MoaA/NifB/PqqE/SkfB family radical SAM enzyme
MKAYNGNQLYGLKRVRMTLRMGLHPELRRTSLKTRLAMNYVMKESKMTRLGNEIYTNTFTPYYPSRAYDRFLKGAVAITSGTPTPVVTNFAVTTKCPCNCWHCSFAHRAKKDVLTLDVMKNAIAQIQDLGTSVIGFTGGEPLLRDDLEDMIALVGDRSMPLLFTTGYKLTRDRVLNLKKAGLKIPVISLDHYLPEIHDRGRGRQGMHETALNAIRLFREEGFYVAVSFVPGRELVCDRREMMKIMDYFKTLGINDMRLTSPILSGHLTAKNDILLTPENVKTLYDIQRTCASTDGYPGVFAYDFFEGRHYYGCGAGYTYMFIDAEGNVCPCDFTMLSFGNILNRPIADIWAETSRHFHRPGLSCYANRASRVIAEKAGPSPKWPLDPDASRHVVSACPPYDPSRLPEYYQRAGLR